VYSCSAEGQGCTIDKPQRRARVTQAAACRHPCFGSQAAGRADEAADGCEFTQIAGRVAGLWPVAMRQLGDIDVSKVVQRPFGGPASLHGCPACCARWWMKLETRATVRMSVAKKV
jgi:hypothetical protein